MKTICQKCKEEIDDAFKEGEQYKLVKIEVTTDNQSFYLCRNDMDQVVKFIQSK